MVAIQLITDMETTSKNSSTGVVYSYNGPGLPTWKAVEAGRAPRERLFGAFQLHSRGRPVEVVDAQWTNAFAPMRKKLPALLEFPSCQLMSAMHRNRFVVIQGRIAPLLQFSAMLLRCHVIYVDVMFVLPRRRVSSAVIGWCLRRAIAIVSYSQSQNEVWAERFSLDKARMLGARYPMDSDFYKTEKTKTPGQTRVVAVGRDIGRDFVTLFDAVDKGGFSLALVTLDYLVPRKRSVPPTIEIFQYLEYPDLFELYGTCTAAVIPLKSGIDYASGIRAALEAMLLSVPVIATRTAVLEEHFVDGEHLLYVPAEDADAILKAVKRLATDVDLGSRLAARARETVVARFGVDQFADLMQSVLSQR